MERRFIPRVLSVCSRVGLAVFLGLAALLSVHAQAHATPAVPHVAVYLKNYYPEYNLATAEFLAAQFDDLDAAAYGLASYTIVPDLTLEALAGSTGLVIDESSDMSLTPAEASVIVHFVQQGGRVGLFTFPRNYWVSESANPASYQLVASIFGNATIGEPDAAEVASGHSAAQFPEAEDPGGPSFTVPYNLVGQPVETYDALPFSPITATGMAPVLVSAALGNQPVAVANSHGLLVTNPIGDLVQGADANETYSQFLTNAIVWLANGGPMMAHQTYFPLVAR